MKNKKLLLILSLAVLTIFALSGCGSSSTDKANNKNSQTTKTSVVETVSAQWSSSKHAKPLVEKNEDGSLSYPGLEAGATCFKCHNGYGYQNQATVKDVKELGNLISGTTCDTCHTGYGADLMKKGTVTVKYMDKEVAVQGGKGAICISCHNGRNKQPNGQSSPHGAVQSDILLGTSGAQVAGVSYAKSPHESNPDTCLSCHMASGTDVKDHTFKVDVKNIKNSCGKCHDSITSFNPVAKADYDGNGKKEGIQTEVSGLIKLVQDEVNKKLNGGKIDSSGGQLSFKDAAGAVLKVEKPVYNAQWNINLVTNDGSKGIHNPGYVVQLLQQSYKELTGKDVPGAEIRK